MQIFCEINEKEGKRVSLNQKSIADFIGLIKYVLGTAQFRSDNVQWNQMIIFAESHHVEVMIYEAASKLLNYSLLDNNAFKRLEGEVMTGIIQDANQISEVEELVQSFDDHDLSAIMLKGWVMKDLYPRTEYRSRADTDIFIHSEDEKKVHAIITSFDYTNHSLGGKKDNVYYKDPFITLEMHKNLFMYEDDWNKIFNDPHSPMYIWNRIEKLDGYQHIYRMDINMYYVYHLAHMVKHLISGGGGIGVKAFLDLWLYRTANVDKMDFDRINADLKILGLTKFADTAWKLACAWFSETGINYPDNSIKVFGNYIMDCGAYGHSDNFVANNEAMRDVKKPNKIKYIARRAFPTRQSMEKRFPAIKKHPSKLPYYWMKRLWRDGFRRKKEVMGEVNSAWHIDYTRVEQVHKMYDKWGIPQIK